MSGSPDSHSTAFLRQLQLKREDGTDKQQSKLLPLVVVGLAFFPFLIPFALVGGLIWLAVKKLPRKEPSQEDRRPRRKKEKRADFEVSPTFTDGEDGVWLSVSKQLEQAQVLKEAGILSPEEYRLWTARIQDYNHS